MRCDPSDSLIQSLGLTDRELICLVGAGGKTSLMERLCEEVAKSGTEVVAATTTKISVPTVGSRMRLFLGETVEEVAGKLDRFSGGIPVVGRELITEGKVNGIPPDWCDALYGQGSGAVWVVEGDGARRLPLKAPGEHEPVLASKADNRIAIATVVNHWIALRDIQRVRQLDDVVVDPHEWLGDRVE